MDEFENSYEGETRDLVQRYEELIKNNASFFLEVEEFENIIEYYLSRNHIDKALEVTDTALDQHPFVVNFMTRKAELLLFDQAFEEALELLEKAQTLEPSNHDIYLLIASVYEDMEDFSAAIESYDTALNLQSGNTDEIYLLKAFTYEGWDRFDDAIDCLKLALQNNPNNKQALYELAYCYDQQNEPEKSIEFYQQFIDEDPFAYQAWYNLGLLYTKINMLEKATEAFDYAIVIKEDYAPGHQQLGKTYLVLGNYEKAIEHLTFYIQHTRPNVATYCQIADCYQNLEKQELARDYYRKALDVSNDYAEAWYGMGITYQKEMRYQQAIPFLEKAVGLKEEEDYWFALADSYNFLSREEQAKGAYRKAIEIDPTLIEAWTEFALMLYEIGQGEASADLVKEGLRENPDSDELYLLLSGMLVEKGAKTEASFYLENGLRLNPEGPELLFEYFPHLEQDSWLLNFIQNNQS